MALDREARALIFFQMRLLFPHVQFQNAYLVIKIALTWVNGLFYFLQFKNVYLAMKIGLAYVHWL